VIYIPSGVVFMDESLLWTIVGGVAGAVSTLFAAIGIYLGWCQLKISKVAIDRTIDVRLWRPGDYTLEAYVRLSNGGTTTAIIDRTAMSQTKCPAYTP
jgi:hypothetical protein